MARFESIGGGREIFGGEEFEGQAGAAYNINIPITNHFGYNHIPIKKQIKKNVKKQTGGANNIIDHFGYNHFGYNHIGPIKKQVKKIVKKQTGPSGAGAMV